MQGDGFAIFKGSIKYDCFYHIYLITDLFANKFHSVIHHLNLECLVWHLVIVFKVKVTVMSIESLYVLYRLYQHIYLISSVPLSWYTVTNSQTK